jgi:type IV secretory pathway VirB2 component (pilin)
MRRLINTFYLSLFVSHFHGAMLQAQAVVDDAQAPGAAFLCRFTDGPRAGRTEPLLGASDRPPSRAGSSCSDGLSSTGVVMALPVKAPPVMAPSVSEDPARQAALTSICQFSSGPRAGEIADLGRVSGAPPVPVGGICSDGASSKGTAIVAPAGGATISWSSPIQSSAAGAEHAVSTICQFMSGPKAHGWHDYAPLPAAPLGSPCRDGVSSAGIVMASGHGQAY